MVIHRKRYATNSTRTAENTDHVKPNLENHTKDFEKQGVLRRVTTSTERISGTVVIQKPGKICICLDDKDLNRVLKRAKFQIPKIDNILPRLATANVFF